MSDENCTYYINCITTDVSTTKRPTQSVSTTLLKNVHMFSKISKIHILMFDIICAISIVFISLLQVKIQFKSNLKAKSREELQIELIPIVTCIGK